MILRTGMSQNWGTHTRARSSNGDKDDSRRKAGFGPLFSFEHLRMHDFVPRNAMHCTIS
jgi:hypothetical protein